MEMILHQQLVMVEAEVVSVLLRVLPVAQRWAEDGAEASRKPLLMFSEDGDRDAVAVALEEWLRSQITNNSLAFNVICAIRAPSTAPSGRSTITWSHMLLLIATNAPGRSAAVAGSPTPICVGVRTGSYWVVSQKVESETTEQESLLLAATFSPAIEFKAICHAHLPPPSVKAADLTGLLGSLYSDFGPLLQTRNLLPIAIFYGSSVKYFNGKSVPAKDSFYYSNSDSQDFYRAGRNKMGGAFNSNKEITPNQMRTSACTMVRTLIQLMRTLDKMPEECTILMKLLYYNNVKPANYELPFFRGCTEEEAHIPWTKHCLKIDIRNVSSKHFVLALKVKSVLDPCEDENDDNQDDSVSLDGDCIQRDELTGSDSETLILLRIAIVKISYIRGLFPVMYFNDKSVPALDLHVEMIIEKLMPMDAESRRLIEGTEKGVYDALQKKYLSTLLFSICETVGGPMLEEYAFSFSYSESQEVSINFNRIGSNKKGGAFNFNKEITPNQMRSSACKMVQTLIQLVRTLDKMPEERTILMKLIYYDDVTPMDHEPHFFRRCTEKEAHKPWTKNPLKINIWNVNSKHFLLALQVKSVLDPCEDENDDNQDYAISLRGDSIQRDEFSSSDSEGSQSDGEQFIVAPTDKKQVHENDGMADSDGTQGPVDDELAYGRVKEWINSYNIETVALTDVLSNFSDISAVLIEGKFRISHLLKLIKESMEAILSKSGANSYMIIKQKKCEYEFDVMEEANHGQPLADGKKSPTEAGTDTMYMKALCCALHLNYISVAMG